jgi:acylpyruvate hydrolase
MKLATLRIDGGTAAVLVDDRVAVEIVGARDVGELLDDPAWRDRAAQAHGRRHQLGSVRHNQWAPVVPRPGKIFCAGLNYRAHILEMGRELPEHPTLFAKFAESLVGAYDEIQLPAVSDQVDWEGELAVVIGRRARRVREADADRYIAGYATFNDVSMRDYQYRTLQWLQGKTFEGSTPFGPHLVTTDEWSPGATLRTQVDGETVQEASTGDLVHSPAALVAYISEILTLQPGDVIATGTPGGVGHARKPPRYLEDGTELVTEIEGLGIQQNRAVRAH